MAAAAMKGEAIMEFGEFLKRKDQTSKEKNETIASAVLSGELDISR
jgi:hypothetical protein